MSLRFLISYAYYRDTDLDRWLEAIGRPVSLFADSGAVTVQAQGTTITVEAYARWLKRWGHLFSAYANLDVIGEHEASAENQKRLEDMGLRPVPVFHGGSPWEVLDELVTEYPYIALGNIAFGKSTSLKGTFLTRCFRAAEGKAALHGFGLTTWSLLRDFPFYSVDSSSWGAGHRYGVVPLFDRGRWVRVTVGKPDAYRHARLIRAHGGEPATIAERDRYHHIYAVRLSMAAWRRAQDWLRQHHGPVGLDGHEPGPHIYLAEGNAENFAIATQGVPV